ncbi:MAG: hypothetical protein HY208_05025 [Nitrospirae bacterium]|nr:hypothetical protein [Nitrospirota bacterium]
MHTTTSFQSSSTLRRRRPVFPLLLSGSVIAGLLALFAPPISAQAPGGFLEKATSTNVRPLLTQSQIQALLPARGVFTFPPPYLTQGIRLTNPSDCGGNDCVHYVGYPYWRNMNNHAGSDTMLIFMGLDRNRGGGGPTLFSYNKVTEAVTNLGPLFDAANPLSWSTGELWYFSATMPTKLYLYSGPKLLRYDVLTKQMETVFDVSTQPALFGTNRTIWQMHSSSDDRVHSATLKDGSTYADLGCLAYQEDIKKFSYYPAVGAYDECQIDKSGRWLVIKEILGIDPVSTSDDRIIDLTTGAVTDLLDRDGGGGHSDNGFGYLVAKDNWNNLPNAVRLWKFGTSPLGPGTVVYYDTQWLPESANHVSHTNANPLLPPEQQYACGSSANATNGPRANEIVCFRLDASLDALVVAPVMTDMNAAGGGDVYSKMPKGNLDVTGQYFVWTSNMGGNRLDAFIVKVPGQLLTGAVSDATPPTVSITVPTSGSTVSGTITASANASDNIGVAGVQFTLDGVNLGAEDATAPYAISWNTTISTAGPHSLTAVARDGAGNSATSGSVTVTVMNDVTPPAIFTIAASAISSSGATITWTTDEPADSQVDYGPTAAYGGSTALNTSLVTSHSQTLSGLAAGALYHYRVTSRDAAGNAAASGDSTFTTLAGGSGVNTGLIGYWKLDDGSGATAADSSGNGNTGALLNGPAWTTGRINQALSFDGVDDYVNIPQTAALNGYPLTIAVWMKTTTTGLQGIVNKYLPGSRNGYQLFTSGGNLCAWYFTDASNYIWDGTGCTLQTSGYNDNQWHHVVLSVVTASSINESGATITWTTDEPADSQVEYGPTTVYGASTTMNPILAVAHSHILSGLTPSTLYHYRVKSKDAAGNLAVSGDFTFTTTDTTPPTVTITSPLNGATVTGTITVSANASDNVGVAGVQFTLDGVNLGAEDTAAPYAISWATATAANGSHALTAVARDGAGNTSTSGPITVTVSNDTTPPVISAVAASNPSSSGAVITWNTDEPSDSQVDYGPTAAYGSSTTLNTSLITLHSQTLSGLAANTLYHYRVRSQDAAGNLAASGDLTLTTLAGASSPGLLGHWKFEEAGGTTAVDSSGSGNTGALMNGATRIAGGIGQALSLDGLDDYVNIPQTTALNAYPLTIAVWMKTTTTGLKGIVNKYAPGSRNGYQLFTSGGNLCAWYFKNGSNYVWDGSGCALQTPGYNDNRWHHAVMVVDASGGKLYVDGVLKASRGWTGTAGAPSTTRPLNIGQYPGTASPYFPGLLDDVRLYSRALSGAEVVALYGAAAPSATQNVIWTSLVNVAATGNSLQKTGGCDGCPDAGAVSQQQITSGNGSMEFTASETTALRLAGLSNGNPGTTGNEIDFAVRLNSGTAEVRENGVYRTETAFVSGDVFRVAVESGVVKYYKNGGLFYTSTAAPVYPLIVDTALYNLNGTVTNAVISTN